MQTSNTLTNSGNNGYQAPIAGVIQGSQPNKYPSSNTQSSLQGILGNPFGMQHYFDPYIAAAQKAGIAFNPSQPAQPAQTNQSNRNQQSSGGTNAGMVPTSLGTYKGVNINPGTDAQIQAQMKLIGGNQQPTQPTQPATNSLSAIPGETLDQYESRVAPQNKSQQIQQNNPIQTPTGQQPAYNAQNPATFPGLVTNLSNISATSTPEYQAAQNQYQTANQQLAQLKQAAANQQFIGAGTNLAEYAGTQGLLSNRLALQEQALTNEMAAAQSAMQTATGQQQVQQTGLTGAAGLSAPTPANVLGFYQPLSGETAPYGGGTAGAFQAGQVQGAFGSGTQYQQVLAPDLNASTRILNQANDFIAKNPDINPSQFNIANYANALIRGQQLSNPKYPILSQYINEFLNTLTNLVGSPGMSTNYKQQIVNDMVNSTSATGSLQQQMQNLLGIATQKAQSIYGTGQTIATPAGQNNQPTVFNTNW